MTRLIISLSLAAILLSGCSLSKKAEIEIRVEALRYAFKAETANWEWEGKKWTEIAQWVFVVECDAYNPEVIGSLRDYPVVSQLGEINRNEGSFVEVSSGKLVAFWRVKNVSRSRDGAYLVDVGCSKGGLDGYGKILSLRNVAGRWVVLSSTRTWVS
jgi:hypothetical protein